MHQRFIIGTLLLLFISCSIQPIFAQKKGKGEPASTSSAATNSDMDPKWRSQEIALSQKVYKAAMFYQDYAEAKDALYRLIALEASNETTNYEDTLLMLYVNTNQLLSGILLGRKMLESSPNDERILSALAVSEQQGGLYEDALDRYKKLHTINQELFNLYQIADIEYKMKRYGECERTLNTILQNPDATTKKVKISYGQGQSQDVPIQSAALNIRGVLELNQGNTAKALQTFEESVKAFPEFQLPQLNIKAIKEQAASGK